MFKHLLTSGLRNLYKYRFFSLLNITGLAIGMAATIIILSWTSFHISFDRDYQNHKQIYRVVQHLKFEDEVTWAITQGLVGSALTNEIPGVDDFCRLVSTNMPLLLNDNDEYRESLVFVDPSFIDIFSIECKTKSTENPLEAPSSIVISESLAQKLFNDENPIGKTIGLAGRQDLTVTGVFSDIPKNSHLQFDCLIDFTLLELFGVDTERWNNSGYYTYLLLDQAADPDVINQQIEHFLDDKPIITEETRLSLQALLDVHRTTDIDFDNAQTVSNTYIRLFLIIGIFILILACINYVNLDTAKASKRSKEIGIKKITGAKSSLLRRQFLGEALILSFVAIALSIIIVGLCKPLFYKLTGINIHFDLNRSSTYFFVFALWLLTGFMAGGYPALYLSKVRPITILRGRGLSSKSGSSLRTILVIFQFCLTILFIIGTLTIYRQIHHMKNTDLGYNKENIVYFVASDDLLNSYEALEQKLLTNLSIESVCISGAPLDQFFEFSNSLWHWPGQDPEQETLFRCVNIGYNFFETHQMEIIEGRAPSGEMATDSSNTIIINEAAAKMMNLETNVDTRIRYYNNEDPFTIIGVVKNFHYRSLHESIEPQILIINPSDCNIISCKMSGVNNAETIEQLKEIVNEINPDENPNLKVLESILNNAYQEDKITGRLLILFTILSILVSILGLIGLMAFVSNQRIPEIGIRKTLGASNISILKLFSWQYLRFISLAIIISWPIALFGIQKYLQNFPNKISMPYLDFVIAGLVALVLVQLTLVIVSLKTVRKAVALCLRNE